MTARYTDIPGKFHSTKCKRRFPGWNWKIWKLLENGSAVLAVA
jgi:hypothetical protein